MGKHELAETLKSRGARVWAQVQYRAKAFIAAVLTIVGTEAVILLADPSFQAQIKAVVPEPYGFLLPVVVGLVTGAIVHAVPNAQKPAANDHIE